MKLKYIYILFIYIFSLEVLSIETKSYNYEDNKVKILLIEKKQNSLHLGLDFNLSKGWKIYWKYPGDSGMPPSVSLENKHIKNNITIRWPFPKELYEKSADITTRIYENHIIFPVYLELNDRKKVKSNILKVKVDFQICKDLCIPISTVLEIELPKNDFFSKKNYNLTKEFEKNVPKHLELLENNKNSLITIHNKELLIRLQKNIFNINKQKDFLVKAFFHNEKISTLRLKKVKESNKEITLTFIGEKSLKAINLSSSKSLVFLKINNTSYYWKQDYANSSKVNTNFFKILTIIIGAFLGGAILNFMPCVLPVLGLKINSFLKQIEVNNKRKIRLSCLSLVLGITFTFLLFSIFATILRILGKSVGWGMQFQNPIFLLAIIVILILFIMNLLGFFNIKVPVFINNFLFKNMVTKHNNMYLKNFFLGIFSTILATPCTAPFVGSAVSIALTQNYFITFLIFFTMAMGKSFPYIIFIFYPGVINFLPKPGKWLKHIKYFFAFLLFITLFWVVNLLYAINKSHIKDDEIKSWEKFNFSKLEGYIKDDITVFVDVTAKWCITCAVNKKLVLDNKEIVELLDKNNVKLVRADWTLKNENILIYLKKYNKFGVPFNILYSKNFPEGHIFNELLTKSQVKKALNKTTSQ
ncbi:protein-disulfide reductase DsbD family protein [Alphaproteobacteria bacterium]|nr:protein-disulfide reductase DsbD family protein [Alphaproteobacteria bacterium]